MPGFIRTQIIMIASSSIKWGICATYANPQNICAHTQFKDIYICTKITGVEALVNSKRINSALLCIVDH